MPACIIIAYNDNYYTLAISLGFDISRRLMIIYGRGIYI